jgi:hypothetical protein
MKDTSSKIMRLFYSVNVQCVNFKYKAAIVLTAPIKKEALEPPFKVQTSILLFLLILQLKNPPPSSFDKGGRKRRGTERFTATL